MRRDQASFSGRWRPWTPDPSSTRLVDKVLFSRGMRPYAAKPARDPVAEALDRAPVGAPFPPEVRAELDAIVEDIRAGRAELVTHEDLPAWLEEQARREQAE